MPVSGSPAAGAALGRLWAALGAGIEAATASGDGPLGQPAQERVEEGVGIDRLGHVVVHAGRERALAVAGHGVWRSSR